MADLLLPAELRLSGVDGTVIFEHHPMEVVLSFGCSRAMLHSLHKVPRRYRRCWPLGARVPCPVHFGGYVFV